MNATLSRLLNFQPGEFAKIALAVFFAAFLAATMVAAMTSSGTLSRMAISEAAGTSRTASGPRARIRSRRRRLSSAAA